MKSLKNQTHTNHADIVAGPVLAAMALMEGLFTGLALAGLLMVIVAGLYYL